MLFKTQAISSTGKRTTEIAHAPINEILYFLKYKTHVQSSEVICIDGLAEDFQGAKIVILTRLLVI